MDQTRATQAPSTRRRGRLLLSAWLLGLAIYGLTPASGALSLALMATSPLAIQWGWPVRGVPGKLLLAASGLCIGLLLGELAVAHLAPLSLQRIEATSRSASPKAYGDDPELGVHLTPHFEGIFTHPEYGGETLRTNSKGFRGPEWSTAEGEGSARVALLGDSMTVGFGVEFQDTIGAKLEERLGARVMNVAVPSYGPSHARVLLERHLEALRPDLVVHLFYDGNDLYNCRSHRALLARRQDTGGHGWLERRPPSILSPRYWSRRSVLGRHIAAWKLARDSRRRTLRHRILEEILHVTRTSPTPDVLEDLAHAEESIRAMAALCDERGARFLLVRIPTSAQAETDGFASLLERYGRPHGSHDRDLPGGPLLETCGSAGILTLDLLDDLTSSDGLSPYYFVEGHLNAAGNATVAESLSREIAASRLLK